MWLLLETDRQQPGGVGFAGAAAGKEVISRLCRPAQDSPLPRVAVLRGREVGPDSWSEWGVQSSPEG